MWKPSILGSVRFSIHDCGMGDINKLRKFSPRNIRLDGDVLTFTVALVHRRETARLFRGRTQTVTENAHIFSLLNFFYSRFVLTVAAVVCIAAFITVNQFVFRIRVVGLSGDEAAAVVRYLDEHNIRPFTPKSKQKAESAAAGIIRDFDFVALANARIRGSSLVFTIHRAGNISAQIALEADITAVCEGVITRLVILGGTAAVGVGDVVRTGDILVSGPRASAIIEIYNGKQLVCIINQTVVSSRTGENELSNFVQQNT